MRLSTVCLHLTYTFNMYMAFTNYSEVNQENYFGTKRVVIAVMYRAFIGASLMKTCHALLSFTVILPSGM